jgi:uncharacterized Zn-finger protein
VSGKFRALTVAHSIDEAPCPTVSSRDVSCDGGDGAYGHPKVYLKIAGDRVTCPYCSRMFVLAPGAVDHGH